MSDTKQIEWRDIEAGAKEMAGNWHHRPNFARQPASYFDFEAVGLLICS